MVEKDYIMRIIHEMVRALLKLIFQIDEEKEPEQIFQDETSCDLYNRLSRMADEGKINEVENMLYEILELEENPNPNRDLEQFKLSLMFYDYLNEKDNDFLESHGYSREEIEDGIKNVMKIYGYEGLAETLLEEL